jgi:hypothetical protein
MSVHLINSKVDNALDKNGTSASDLSDQAIISSLFDRTFISYAPEMVVKMPYYFSTNYTQTSGTLGTGNQFKINSIYDPDLTGAGHQPLGRDTWAGIYDYYKVLETRVEVTMTSNLYQTEFNAAGGSIDNGASTIFCPSYVGGLLDITANPPTTFTSWQEAKSVTSNSQQRFSQIQRLFHVASRGPAEVSYNMKWEANMFDTAVLNPATTDTWTPVGSDPDDLNYFSTLSFASNTTRTVGFQLEVKLMYLVAFKNVNRTLLNTTQ